MCRFFYIVFFCLIHFAGSAQSCGRQAATQNKVSKTPAAERFNVFDCHISFSDSLNFEVYDRFGNCLLKGYGMRADISTLETGVYTVIYGIYTDKFIRKKANCTRK